MKLEVGKRYVMRNGYITNAIAENSNSNVNVWTDGTLHWLVGGQYSSVHYISPLDIVAEYVDPQPQQPLRWVENTKPDKPGIWAWVVDEGMFEATWISGSSSLAECVSGTWCCLGPIPEILPPKRKVVERLWLEAMANGIEPQTVLYRMHWCVDDNTKAYPINWIRTDNTREVER